MTQQDEILRLLRDRDEGMTAQDLHLRTGVAKNVLGTHLWQMKKDGLITRVGGVRGSYRYGITDRGKDRLGEGTDPLGYLTKTMRRRQGEEGPVPDFGDMLKLVNNIDTYRRLKGYSEWLSREHPALVNADSDVGEILHGYVLEYLGIDSTSFHQQQRALEDLIEYMKGVPD
jgi:hypothetical protein